jgi:hypothetical protein
MRTALPVGVRYGEIAVSQPEFGVPSPVTLSQPDPTVRLESRLNVRSDATVPSELSTPFA